MWIYKLRQSASHLQENEKPDFATYLRQSYAYFYFRFGDEQNKPKVKEESKSRNNILIISKLVPYKFQFKIIKLLLWINEGFYVSDEK